jgi:integrase
METVEPTIKAIADSLILYKKYRVKASTVSVYQRVIENHIIPVFGDKTYSEVFNHFTIENFCYNAIHIGMSTTTVKSIYRMFVALMNHAGDRFNMPLHNIRVNWPVNEPPRLNIEVYNARELTEIVDYIISNITPQYLGILLALSSGMRIGEVCGLRYEDIDISNNIITIHRTVSRIPTTRGHTEVICSAPKTSSSNRQVPLLPDLVSVVQAYKSIHQSNAYVCTGQTTPCEPRRLSAVYHDLILHKVGLQKCLKFHALRHSFATYLLQQKVDIKTVSALLGHSKVATTFDIYIHPSIESKRRAVGTLIGEIFKKHRNVQK